MYVVLCLLGFAYHVLTCQKVYCNKCYQHRSETAKISKVNFEEVTNQSNRGGRPTKAIQCAVDGCRSDVKSKDKWVGVFL